MYGVSNRVSKRPEMGLMEIFNKDGKLIYNLYDYKTDKAVKIFEAKDKRDVTLAVVEFLMVTRPDIVIMDDDFPAMIQLENGIITALETEYGMQDSIAREDWFGVSSEPRWPEPSCSRCGDGGCPHCEPWRFL